MDAGRYLALARRWWWLLILGMVVAVGAFAFAAQAPTPPPDYEASTTLFVRYLPGTASDTNNAGRLAVSYAEMATARPVMELVAEDLGASESVESLQSRVEVEVPAGTQLLRITAAGPSAVQAERLAEATAQAFQRVHGEAGLPGSVFLFESEEAVKGNGSGANVTPAMLTLVAVFGLVGAAGVLLLLDYLSGAVKTPADAEAATRLPVLASVPVWSARAAMDTAASGADARAAERYRMLRTSFAIRTEGEPASAVLFTAASSGDGTTTTAASFAIALARAGRNVALVDTNLRRPSLHTLFGLTNDRGLAETLAAGRDASEPATQRTELESLHVLTAGNQVSNPSELLASERFDQVLNTLRRRFDVVVLDSPPALNMTDATVLAAKADATIVVLRAERTGQAHAATVVETLRRATSRMLGVVLNADVSSVPGGLREPFETRAPSELRGAAEAELQPAERTTA